MTYTLLLTGCINPKGKIASKSSNELILSSRMKQYQRALNYYLLESHFEVIVFCDNSNFSHSFISEFQKIAEEKGKILEYITYDGNQKSAQYGYGYSECEIIDYAWEKSLYLRKAKSWYKITGRYILDSINDLISLTKKSDFYFHKQGIFDSWFTVSTSFFLINNAIYEKYLYKKHIQLFESIYSKPWREDYFVNGSIPIEKIWYILLREYISENRRFIHYSVAVYYIFPVSIPSWFPVFLGEKIRKTIYFLYYSLNFDILFSLLHSVYDSMFFERINHKLLFTLKG